MSLKDVPTHILKLAARCHGNGQRFLAGGFPLPFPFPELGQIEISIDTRLPTPNHRRQHLRTKHPNPLPHRLASCPPTKALERGVKLIRQVQLLPILPGASDLGRLRL
ncbi:MAG: hypothetical protein VW362_08440, partial [Candidatus Nanopelagicales bacterium]